MTDAHETDVTLRATMAKLLETAHRAGESDLITASSGNLSIRLDEERFAITKSGVRLAECTEDDIIVCAFDIGNDDGRTADSSSGASMETPMHRALYRACDDIGAILHAQPLFSTLVACADAERDRSALIPTGLIPESMVYIPHIAEVGYHHPGSLDLAHAVVAAIRAEPRPEILLLGNHGTLSWGADATKALLRTETLEFVAKLAITARAGGVPLNVMAASVQRDFRDHLRSIGKTGV